MSKKIPSNVLVSELMSMKAIKAFSNESISSVLQLMQNAGVESMPVVDERNHLVGITTSENIVTKCIALGNDAKNVQVGKCMITNPVTVLPSSTCEVAIKIMAGIEQKELPIVINDRLVGCIRLKDISKYFGFSPYVCQKVTMEYSKK